MTLPRILTFVIAGLLWCVVLPIALILVAGG